MTKPILLMALLLNLAAPAEAQKPTAKGKLNRAITADDCKTAALTKGRRDLPLAILGGGTTTCTDSTEPCKIDVVPYFDEKNACTFEVPKGTIDVEKSFKGGLLVWAIEKKATTDLREYRFAPKKGVDIVSGNNNKKEDLDDPASGPNDQRFKWTDLNKSSNAGGKKSFCYEVVLEYKDDKGKWQGCKRIDPIINNSGD